MMINWNNGIMEYWNNGEGSEAGSKEQGAGRIKVLQLGSGTIKGQAESAAS